MICPSCQNQVTITEQNHGALYTCGQCQAVYFINFEGQAEYSDVPDSLPPEMLADAIPVAEDPYGASLEPLVDTINVVSVDSPLESSLADELHALSVPENVPDETPEEASEAVSLETPQEAISEAFPEAPDANDSNPFEEAFPPVTDSGESSFSQAAREISDFGNAEVQLAGINYDLHITGLDTQETMRLFKEAIEDSKFGWDITELLKTVRNGEVKFQRLSPVKAYILAKRLQFLDIEKHWKQNVLS